MIDPSHTSHRAHVDENGNIILPSIHDSVAKEIEMEEGKWHSIEQEKKEERLIPAWAAFEEEQVPAFMAEEEQSVEKVREWEPPQELTGSIETQSPAFPKVWKSVREQVSAVTNGFVSEGTQQYETTLQDSVVLGRSALSSLRSGLHATWRFVTQPVWVPGRNNRPKQYGRGVLFALDIVRFGGTFASLFVVLFVSLNFQSFWTIAQSYVNPITDITSGKILSSDLNQSLADKLKQIPSLPEAGGGASDLTAYLPDVGPPQDRLIIPKMNLNVPIIVPPNTNLLSENWKGLEDDIQHALQQGVVHYPGTARPGQAGNFFVTGHSSYFPWDPGKYKSVFARLDELNVGDEYWVYYGGDKFRYVVTAKKVIEPTDVSVLDQPVNKRVSTLMTCTPVGTALHRLVIQAQEVDPVTGQPMTVGQHSDQLTPHTNVGSLPI